MGNFYKAGSGITLTGKTFSNAGVLSIGGATGVLGLSGAVAISGSTLVGPTVTGTANQVSVLTAGTTSITISLPSAVTFPGTMTAPSASPVFAGLTSPTLAGDSTGLTITSGGTNKNIILTPSGSGIVKVSKSSGQAAFQAVSASGSFPGFYAAITGEAFSRAGIELNASDQPILFFSAGASDKDIAIGRTSAGLLEINSGTQGTLRDLSCRAATLTGSLTLPSNGLNVGSGQLQVTGGNVLVGGLLQVGGTTNSFAALKRNGTDLQAVLGDGSNYTKFVANAFDSFGNVTILTAGKGIQLQSGTNQRAGNATLVAGTITVANTSVTANTLVKLTRKTIGGTVGNISYTLSAATSFTINSDSATDTSTYTYELTELN